MTQRKLAEKIIEQANRYDWSVCCLCSNFDSSCECEHFDKPCDAEICIGGVRRWLMEQNKSKVVEE